MKAKAARKKRGGKDKKSEAASRTKKGLKRIPPKKVTPKTRKTLSTKGKGATVKKSMVKKPRLKVEAARPKNSKLLKSETPLRGKKKSESEALDLPKTSNLESAKDLQSAKPIDKSRKKSARLQSGQKEERDFSVEQSLPVQLGTSHSKPIEEIRERSELKVPSSPKKRKQTTPPEHVQIEDLSVKPTRESLPERKRSGRKPSPRVLKEFQSQSVVKQDLLVGTKDEPSSQSGSSQASSFSQETRPVLGRKGDVPAPVSPKPEPKMPSGSSDILGSVKAAKPDAVQSLPPKRLPFKIPPILLEGDEPTQAYAPMPVPGAKFALLPKTESVVAAKRVEDQVTNELPAAYGTGKLLLLARDPHTVYTSWDFTDLQQRELNSQARDHHLIIRIYRERIADKPVSEVHVHPESRHWFVHVDEAATQYVAQLGFIEENGGWIPVASSAPVTTPAEKISEQKALRFATVHQAFVRSPMQSVNFPADNKASVVYEKTEEAVSRPINPAFAAEHLEHTRKMVVHEARPYEAQTMGEYQQQKTAVASVLHHNQSWTSAKEQELWEEIGFASKQRNPASSIDVDERSGRKLNNGMELEKLGALETPALSSEAILLAPAVESEVPLESLSSAFGGEGLQRVSTSFWFNVNAELIIYGATEPDAAVSIGGRRIRLRPDGSFSYRFSLPDGQYPLPVTATSKDNDVRRAELTFSRNTVYSGQVDTHPQDPALRPPKSENLL